MCFFLTNFADPDKLTSMDFVQAQKGVATTAG